MGTKFILYHCPIGGVSLLLGEEADLKVWIIPEAALRNHTLGIFVCPLAVEVGLSSALREPEAG